MSKAFLTHISYYIYIYIHTKVKGSQSEQNACQHHSCADLDKYTPTSWIKTREQSEQTACQDTHLPHKIAELLASLGQEVRMELSRPRKETPQHPNNAPTPDFTIHVACGCSTRHEGETRDVEETHPRAMPGQMLAARCKTQTTE